MYTYRQTKLNVNRFVSTQSIKFCPRCHVMMKYDSKEKVVCYICPRCGYKEEFEGMVLRQEYPTKERVKVIDSKERRLHPTPICDTTCPKCKNGRAYCWTIETGGEQSSTQFFRCTRCRYTWRLCS